MIKRFVGCMLLLGLGVCSYAQSPVYDVPKMDGITIDGKDADWGNSGFRVDVLAGKNGETLNPKDLDGKVRIGWNERGLLLLVRVQDDVAMEAEKQDDIVWQDSVELYTGTAPGSRQYYQAVIAPGIDPRQPKLRIGYGDLRKNQGSTILNLDAATARIEGGYIVECCLPWSNLGTAAREGDKTALQIMVNDADETGPRFSVGWHPNMAAWDDPAQMQALRLSRKSSAPVDMLARPVKDDDGRRIEVVAPAEFSGKEVKSSLKNYVLDKAVLRTEDGRARAKLPALAMLMTVSVKGCSDAIADFDKIKEGGVVRPDDLALNFQPSIFSGTAFPPCAFDNPEQAKRALGTYKITTAFYDADFNEVKTADKPGRYGAVVTATGSNGQKTVRCITLYHLSQPFRWSWGQFPAQTISLPASFEIDKRVLEEQKQTIANMLVTVFELGAQTSGDPAIVFAALHETKPGSEPYASHRDPFSMNADWWFSLKKKIGMVREDYYVQLPSSYENEPTKRWPLILFLHGAGERGDNLAVVDRIGLPQVAKHNPDFPFIVIAPQCPANEWWNATPLNDLLDRVIKKYRVDEDRIYLTGLSMGGYGTWTLALASPERFAAIVPICGGGDSHDAARIKDLPTWVFHGDADDVVTVEHSRDMVNALQKLGGRVRYTEFPGVRHDSWTAAYSTPELYDWLLKQKRGEPQEPHYQAK